MNIEDSIDRESLPQRQIAVFDLEEYTEEAEMAFEKTEKRIKEEMRAREREGGNNKWRIGRGLLTIPIIGIVYLTKIILFPVLMILSIFFPEIRSRLAPPCATYIWYRSKKDFEIVSHSCADCEGVRKTYKEWQEDAHNALKQFEVDNIIYFKVIMRPKKYFHWLKKNGLDNCTKSRAEYAVEIFNTVRESGIE